MPLHAVLREGGLGGRRGGPGVWEAKGISKGGQKDPIAEGIAFEKKGTDPKPCTPEMLHGFRSELEIFLHGYGF